MYIYKLGTECDGAQTRASDVYVPTLVALLGLCFDPSECFRDLRVWSRVVGNKSGKLWYMLQIVTFSHPSSNPGLLLSQSMSSMGKVSQRIILLRFIAVLTFTHSPKPISWQLSGKPVSTHLTLW